MKIGFIGLGRMGSRMVEKLLLDNHEILVWNRSAEKAEEFKIQNSKFKNTIQNLKVSETIEELVQSLEPPRIIWSMVTAGDATQAVLDELLVLCSPSDIVIDGGNSHFRDTEDRYKTFKEKGIRFLGIGVSGGIIASKQGYPLMVGGDKEAYDSIVPLLNCLAKPNGGCEYFGEGGAGHFVKMVHNGIEYGYMQSIGEGFGVLQGSQYKFDLLKIAKLYQKETLLSGFMMDRTVEALSLDSTLSDVVGIIEESGEAKWTVEEAESEQVSVAVIKASLEFRIRSKNEPEVQNSFAARLIAALRNAFGGHEVKKK